MKNNLPFLNQINSLSLSIQCRSQWPRSLKGGSAAHACWDCGFESRRGHACLSVVSVVCCQVEVFATGWSLVQRSPTEYICVCVCVCPKSVIAKPRTGKSWTGIGSKRHKNLKKSSPIRLLANTNSYKALQQFSFRPMWKMKWQHSQLLPRHWHSSALHNYSVPALQKIFGVSNVKKKRPANSI